MKPMNGFWLIFSALIFQALWLLLVYFFYVNSASIIPKVGVTLFALATLYVGFFKTMDRINRVSLILVGVALLLESLLAWRLLPMLVEAEVVGEFGDPLETVTLNFKNVFDFPLGTVILAAQALAALVLGFSAPNLRRHRLFMLFGILTVSAFLYGGINTLGITLVIIGFLAILAIFGGFFGALGFGFAEMGEEDARLIREGKRPKYGPPPFGPNNPFKK